MKIVIINGQNHKGSTYHTARMLANKIGGEITEFFSSDGFWRILLRMHKLLYKIRKIVSPLCQAKPYHKFYA